MNYWNLTSTDLESFVFRRPAAFDGLPFGFSFDTVNQLAPTTTTAAIAVNPDQCAIAAQDRDRLDQSQQQAIKKGGANVEPPTLYHHQQQPQQNVNLSQHDNHSAPTITFIKMDNRPLQLNGDMFLQPLANNTLSSAPLAVGGVLSAPSSSSNATGNTAPSAAACSSGNDKAASSTAAKSKKKKKKPNLQQFRGNMAPPQRQQCQQCERNYGNRRDLRRHVLAHHQGIRYMCRLCGKVMMSSKSVRAHLKSSAHRLSNTDDLTSHIEKVNTNAPGSNLSGFNTAGVSTASANDDSDKKPT